MAGRSRRQIVAIVVLRKSVSIAGNNRCGSRRWPVVGFMPMSFAEHSTDFFRYKDDVVTLKNETSPTSLQLLYLVCSDLFNGDEKL